MVTEINEILGNQELIDIDTSGTNYMTIKYNPITTEITTILKRSTGNGTPIPETKTYKEFCHNISWLQEFNPKGAAVHMKILKRIKKYY